MGGGQGLPFTVVIQEKGKKEGTLIFRVCDSVH